MKEKLREILKNRANDLIEIWRDETSTVEYQ